jgi:hypothetical protein
MGLKRFIRVAALALPLGAMAASSYFPEFYRIYKPEVGGWSKYALTDASGDTATLKFAVVSQVSEGHWLEMTSVSEGGSGTVGYLVSGDPADDAHILKIRVQDEGGPLMEIDRETLRSLKAQGQQALGRPARPIGPTVGKLQPMPDEVLEVSGRKIKCQHMVIAGAEGKSAEAWVSDEVAPFGLVKLLSGEEKVLLLDFGTGAKPALAGKAVPLTLP